MLIRPARLADADAIADVHVGASRVAYAHLPASLVSTTLEARRAQWNEAVRDEGSRLWVAEVDGQVIGFCHYWFPSAERAELATLYIDPGHWRKGIGRALAERAWTEATERGCRRVTLWVYEENQRARAAYEAMGFVAEPGTVLHQRTGLMMKEYVMEL